MLNIILLLIIFWVLLLSVAVYQIGKAITMIVEILKKTLQ